MKKYIRKLLAFTITSLLITTYSNLESKSEDFLYKGKCAFLVTSEYKNNCDIIFSNNIITLIPKGSEQKRIWPFQISHISLASEKSLVPDEDISKWSQVLPEYQESFFFIFKSKKKNRIPSWVIDATSKEVESHKFTIRYLDKRKRPQALLFVLDDRSKASGMLSMLQSYTDLKLGSFRKSGEKIDQKISKGLTKEAIRKANRLSGLCRQEMFEEAKLITNELNNFVDNITDEIYIFDDTDELTKDLLKIKDSANNYCDKIKEKKLADKLLKKEKEKKEQEKIEAIKKEKEEKEKQILLEKQKAREAFDMLSEF